MSPEQISAQLERMLDSPVFENSGRITRFLRFVVEQTLAGGQASIKGYTIGIEVFDRDASFDPAIDSIVRVEAGRLRAKIREYYETAGAADPLRIELPKGAYVPVFTRMSEVSRPVPVTVSPVSNPASAIAVLPFENLGPDASQDYFGDGMTDAIISNLCNIRGLHVISRTSVIRFKNSSQSLPEIAAQLKAKYILEGSFLRDGDEIRVNTQLVDGASDHRRWSASYDRCISAILKLQSEIAGQIATAIGQEISPQSSEKLHPIGPVNSRGYEEYLLGKYYRSRLTPEGFTEALLHFDASIQTMPEFAPAYCGKASCYCAMGSHGAEIRPPQEIIPLGIEYAEKSIALDSGQAEAHAYLSIMLLKYRWDWVAAKREVDLALELNPGDSRARWQHSLYFETLGKFDQAVHEAELALLVDPLSALANFNLGWQHYQAGSDEQAIAVYQRNQTLNPGFWGSYWGLGHVYRNQQRYADAIQAFEQAVTAMKGHALALHGLAYTHTLMGDQKSALSILKHLEGQAEQSYVSPYYFAVIEAGLGNHERMYESLEAAYQQRSRSLAWLAVAREFAGYHKDQNFSDLLLRIGIPTG